ncbi:MAG: hypothetical protein GF350_16495, partial [Chitinivibrionales bacterium]|nr:hypothetical protein [Chitinivibrionales bacterium]
YAGQSERFSYYQPLHGDVDFGDNDSRLGYLLLVPAVFKNHDKLFRSLAHIAKPIAVLDIVGGWELPYFLQKRHVRLFSAAVSPRCGKEAARYLIQAGHRKIAYISPFHNSLWSHNRLEGLQEIYKAAGDGHSVYPFTMDYEPKPNMIFRKEAYEACDYKPLMDAYDTWKTKVPDYFHRPMDDLIQWRFLRDIIPYAELQHRLEELFLRILDNNSITAWVCANDQIATWALQYLKKETIAVPGRTSLLGFDDSYDALRDGITSYSFNLHGAIAAMLNFILRPSSIPLRKRPVEIPGMIMERGSVRRI